MILFAECETVSTQSLLYLKPHCPGMDLSPLMFFNRPYDLCNYTGHKISIIFGFHTALHYVGFHSTDVSAFLQPTSQSTDSAPFCDQTVSLPLELLCQQLLKTNRILKVMLSIVPLVPVQNTRGRYGHGMAVDMDVLHTQVMFVKH